MRDSCPDSLQSESIVERNSNGYNLLHLQKDLKEDR